MKQFINRVKQISILILTISLFGCTSDDASVPKVIAGFTYTLNPTTGTVTFLNTSENARNYVWDFGDKTTSIEIDPIKTYAAGKYTVVLIAKNEAGASATFESVITILPPPVVCTPETVQSLAAADFNVTFQAENTTATIVADGAAIIRVTNPDFDNAINKSCQVGKITRDPALQFANNQFNFASKFDFTTKTGYKIKVWSATPETSVTVKLEGTGATEKTVKTTKTSAWEELTFDFTAADSNKFNKIVLFFNLGTNTPGVFYIDDFKLYGTGSGSGGGGTPPAFNSGLLVNGDFQSGAAPWIIGVGTAPAPVKTVAGNTYYSVNVTAAGNSYDVNVSQKLTIVQGKTYTLTFDAWSDRARSVIAGIGLSGGDFSNTVKTVNITTTRTTYTVEVGATNFGAADARVLFDLGAAVGEVNIDNVSLIEKVITGGGGSTAFGIAQNGDFETGVLSGWLTFQNGGISRLDNTVNNGGTWSGKLETNGPSNPAFKQEAIGAGVVKSGDLITIKFDVKGALTQPGAVFNVLLFGEGANGASFTKVFNPAPTVTNAWTTFTGTYTIGATTDVSKGISFLIEAVCGADAGCKVSANIDNVSVKIN
ncbi:MAG: hypothetical protein ACI87N_000413 [Flavobacteriales bacterium]|jgi:hypothetical protein